MGHRTRAAIAVVSGMIALAATFVGAATPAAAQASTATTTATTDTYCAVNFTVNQWPGAAIVNVSIRNISTVTVRWQLLRLTFPGPVPATGFWNVMVTQSGSVLTVVPSSFTPVPGPDTGVLAPGQSVTIGYLYYSGGFFALPDAMVTCTPV